MQRIHIHDVLLVHAFVYATFVYRFAGPRYDFHFH